MMIKALNIWPKNHNVILKKPRVVEEHM